MGSQLNLANRSEVVSIYKCSPKFWGPLPQILGAKKHQIFYHFRDLTPHISGMKRRIDKLVSIY